MLNAFPRILLVYDTTLKANVMKTCNIRFYTSSAVLQENIHGNNVSAAKSFPINILDSKALLKIKSEWKKSSCSSKKKTRFDFFAGNGKEKRRNEKRFKGWKCDTISEVVEASALVTYIYGDTSLLKKAFAEFKIKILKIADSEVKISVWSENIFQ